MSRSRCFMPRCLRGGPIAASKERPRTGESGRVWARSNTNRRTGAILSILHRIPTQVKQPRAPNRGKDQEFALRGRTGAAESSDVVRNRSQDLEVWITWGGNRFRPEIRKSLFQVLSCINALSPSHSPRPP